ncbi:hypothetical protein PPL_10025 [Heterostelium album PN500]|uniref:Ankyrin repeat protein n=1 Tax=Heterostelium pallidum (strain ATCC 26659 / Pp 5 / PN500) TaxID=670386 RepID=D3BPY1_HETP5|nr:hypothetical protein PPL_10025 [Heterostelium album PN500]EFA76264.1 hypothetical protein PPL_10025 [Heterostelium album PN500]|eukprot:XP_020428397.1 hypothetical protein PPL_10025 [Heterostelium album PN500]
MNKEIFSRVFNNLVLNKYIFNQVNEINDRYECDVYSWLGVIRSPEMMITYGYFDQLKQYYQQNLDHILFHDDHLMYDQTLAFMKTVVAGRFDIFMYMWDLFKILKRTYDFLDESEDILSKIGKKAVIHDRIDFIRFLLESVDEDLIYQLFEISPKSHNLEMVQYLTKIYIQHLPGHQRISMYNCSLILDNVAFVGRIDMFKWLIANKFDIFKASYLLRKSVLGGNIEFAQYLLEHYPKSLDSTNSANLINCAARADSLEIMKLLHNQYQLEIDVRALTNAANNNNLEMLKWVVENSPMLYTTYFGSLIIHQAVKNNNLEMVKWLTENATFKCSTSPMDMAAKKNYMDILEYLHHNRTEGCSNDAMGFAAKKGHLNIIRWIHENRTEGCENFALDQAAMNGHIEVLQWFKENRTERCTKLAVDHAGSLKVMKWLRQNQTELKFTNPDIISRAAKYGNLDAIKWILENCSSIECNHWLITYALENNHFNVVGWLLMNRKECKDYVINDDLFLDLLEYDLSIAQWILDNRDIPLYKIVKYQSILENSLPNSLTSLEFLDNYIAIKQQENLKKRKYKI